MKEQGFTTDRTGKVPVLRSGLITCPHGFSTREGGVSTLPHLASLNLGFDLGDEISFVNENRSRFFTSALGVPTAADGVVLATQIHSDTVFTAGKRDIGRSDLFLDGFVTAEPGVPLFIRTADCCPLLFHDPVHRVIGACHAGWRGTVAGIAARTVDAMCALGAEAVQIRCAIGACIRVCCYEVGDDFADAVRAALPPGLAELCLVPWEDGRIHADLIALNRALLLGAGLTGDHIDVSPSCTACRPDVFFSHRACRGKRGLMGAVIMLNGDAGHDL